MISQLVNSRIFYKRRLSLLVFFILTIVCFGQTDRWVNFDKALKNYNSNPTHDNSIKAYELLPDNLSGGDYPNGKILESIYLTVLKLEKMIVNENIDALRLGFKLYTIADGEFAESLDITIGKLIIKNPNLFLQELKNHRKLINNLGGLVGNYGPDFVDNMKLTLSETEKRIKTLKKVNDLGLIKTRDECLKQLESFEDDIKNIIKEK